MKDKPTCYLAGPMTGVLNHNFPAFYKAEEDLVSQGYSVINPARLDEELGFDPTTDKQDVEFLKGAVRRDINGVIDADVIVLLPNWETSKGAKAEVAVALWLKKTIWLYPSMVRLDKEDVCDIAKRLTSFDRQADYGSPIEDFTKQAKMWSVILNTRVTPQQIAMCMIAVKMSRLTNSPRHRDSVIDIVGYARCLDMCNQATSL